MERQDKDVKSRKQIFADLNHRCKAIEIWTNDPENTMNLEELKALPSKELLDIYNKHAAKQVKRMESRAKLEERTAQLLRDSGELKDEPSGAPDRADSNPPAARGKSKKTAAQIEPTTTEGDTTMANAKKTTKTTKKTAAPAAEKKGRGAPVINYTYTAISEKAKNYNPDGLKLQASSARGLVLEFVRGAEGGKTRKQIETKFPDINTKSALDVLVKYGFLNAKE